MPPCRLAFSARRRRLIPTMPICLVSLHTSFSPVGPCPSVFGGFLAPNPLCLVFGGCGECPSHASFVVCPFSFCFCDRPLSLCCRWLLGPSYQLDPVALPLKIYAYSYTLVSCGSMVTCATVCACLCVSAISVCDISSMCCLVVRIFVSIFHLFIHIRSSICLCVCPFPIHAFIQPYVCLLGHLFFHSCFVYGECGGVPLHTPYACVLSHFLFMASLCLSVFGNFLIPNTMD